MRILGGRHISGFVDKFRQIEVELLLNNLADDRHNAVSRKLVITGNFEAVFPKVNYVALNSII